jgi:hypothetical protein
MTAHSTGGGAHHEIGSRTATASIGFAIWDGHHGHNDASLRAIHYDTSYDLSAQRRAPAE